MSDEVQRILNVYDKRAENKNLNYNPLLPPNYYIVNSREKQLVKLLYKYFGKDLSHQKALDVGFGNGSDLLTLIKYGFDIKNLYGTELLEERFKKVCEIIPNANLKLIDGFFLPFENNSIDLIIQSTVFSSILNEDSRKELANEMLRVLAPNGKIFSYDIRFSNPWNENVIKIDKKEIKSLFKNCKINFYPVTLNPIFARKFAYFSLIFCEILSFLPLFRSHYFSTIEKK